MNQKWVKSAISITNHIDKILLDLNADLNQFGENQTAESTLHINSKLENYHAEIKNGEQRTSKESNQLFTHIMDKTTKLGTDILKLDRSEGENLLGDIQLANYDLSKFQEQKLISKDSLEEEINLTVNTINQLNEIQASEDNQAIKDFIQRKINLLNEIITQLQTEQ